MIHLKRFITFTVLFQLLMLHGSVQASEREYALKAGFLYNFARYSEGSWFNSTTEQYYNVCSTNNIFVLAATKTLRGQQIKNRPIKVKLISNPDRNCHSLFIPVTQLNIPEYIQHAQFHNTMLIGEAKGFIQSGGHLNFFIAGGKVRFEVSPKNLRASQIKLSSKVLRMGRILKGHQ